MYMYDINKYRYYSDGENKIVAVTTYAGKTVRGVAKCDPRDTFDMEKGKALAAARCSVRVADRRHKRAAREFLKALHNLELAQNRVDQMREYVRDSFDQLTDEMNNLDIVSAEL